MFKLPFDSLYSFEELCGLSKSQAKQDLFVLAMLEGKTDGTFLEIGAGRPIVYSNCELLENKFNWSGVSIDRQDFTSFGWEEHRKRSQYVIADAATYDYNLLPNHFDYLQIDIDDPFESSNVLSLLDNKEFSVITLEHDVFQKKAECFAWKNFARQTLVKKGYVVLADNVCVKVDDTTIPKCFEDWYVHPKYVRIEVIQAYRSLTLDYSLKFGEDVLFTQND